MSLAACVAPKPVPSRPPPTPLQQPWVAEPARERGLYTPQEALRDVLSGELEYIGTGRWPGVERMRACAFRNRRVVVVNAYCALHEPHAFRVDVFSPQRGRVRIYAEASGAISARQRGEYFTFMVESSPPAGAAAHLPGFSLAMPYDELRSYERQRYEAYLPSCYGGEQHDRLIEGCLGTLATSRGEWAALNSAFWDHANADWYQVVRTLRRLAARYGVHPVN